jgi:Fe-S-cluster containining protein
MVALVLKNTNLIDKIAQLYQWLDEQAGGSCNSCGNCCDFDSYGHRLYVTIPEMMYLAEKIGKENIKPMTTGRCPYQVDNRCSVHPHRFVSCRIFFCRGDAKKQSLLSEEAISKLKALCLEFAIPYRYSDLKTASEIVRF